MKRNTNAVYAAFKATFESTLQEQGIEPSGVVPWHPCTPEFTLDTKAGKYTCHVGPNLTGDGSKPLNFCSVMGRFHDPAKAHRHVDCNPYTGKWNFDGNGYIPAVEQAEALARGIVERILKLR